ncbi:MAG: ROK family protein [Acidimicrobiia bacterium]
MSTTVGIDIGGSSVTAVTRDDSAEIVGRYKSSASLQGGYQVAASAVEAWRSLATDDCVAVGVGVPGRVNPETGQVSLAVNLGIGPEPFDLAGEIESEIGLPVAIENDVKIAALGAHEALTRAGNGVACLVVVSIGTGISAGVVVDGAVLRGASGMAGEIGHIVVDDAGPVCRCGQRGCLEALAAGPAIGKAWPGGPDKAAASALFAALAAGDRAAETVANRIVGHLTTALIWLAAAYDPDLILLAGGVVSAGETLLDVVRSQIEDRGAVSELAARRLRPEQVQLASVGDPPGPRGAALLAARNSVGLRVSPAVKKASNDK